MDRIRQALFLAAVAMAALAAWWGGTSCFRPAPADAALLGRPFPAAQAPQAVQREDRTLESFKAITGRRLVPPAPAVPVAPLGPPPFSLLGTNYDAAAPQDSTAQVRNSQGDVRAYKVGQTVKVDEAKLLAVVALRARFLWRGREVWMGPEGRSANPIVLPEGAAAPPARTEYAISAAEWNALYADKTKLWTQIAIRPNVVDGRLEGLRILGMEEAFPGRKYGLQVNDVLLKVNGADLNSMEAAIGLFNTLSKPQDLAVEVGRGGRKYTLTLKVAEPPPPPKPPAAVPTPRP